MLNRQLMELYVILSHILRRPPVWPPSDNHPDDTGVDLGEEGGGGGGDPPPPYQERPDAEVNIPTPAAAAVGADVPASSSTTTAPAAPNAPPRTNRRRRRQSQPTEQPPATPATVQQRVTANQVVQVNNNQQQQRRRNNNQRQQRRRRLSGSTDKPERVVPAPVNVGDASVDPPSPIVSEPPSPVSTVAPVSLPSGRPRSLPGMLPPRPGYLNWERLEGLRRIALQFQLSIQTENQGSQKRRRRSAGSAAAQRGVEAGAGWGQRLLPLVLLPLPSVAQLPPRPLWAAVLLLLGLRLASRQ